MAYALMTVGIILLIASVRNTQGDLFALLKGDFTGQNNFIYWVLSILIIGSLGYIPKLKSLSTAFLGLVIVVLFLKKGNPINNAGGGFFNQFFAAVGTTQTAQSKSYTNSPTITDNNPSPNVLGLPQLPNIFQ